jgi:activator-of-BECN1-regulated-autophagy protein 1
MNDPSALQPSWRSFPYPFHESQQPQLNNSNSNMNDDSSDSPQPWPTPSAAEVEERWHHRNNILEQTANHLLVHPHEGMSDTARNIALVLYDRERRGPSAVTTPTHLQRSRWMAAEDSSSTTLCNSKIGDRSPSTVLESPTQRVAPAEMAAMDTSLLTRAALGSLTGSPTRSSIRNTTSDAGASSVKDCTSASSGKLSLRRVTYPLTIAREIRTFGEYCSATKYHSAFLTHLGGDDVLDAEGNPPPSSRAVSTISIAFSPDGQTMASTHGDHTVKLSCCSTGRLLQSLDGHPRTPWTVKYHPTDSRILASGCLGHQVRVWNWETKICLQMIRLEFAIISLSFHPAGTVLAIANGTRLHFWGIDDCESADNNKSQQQQPRIAVEQLAQQQRQPTSNNRRAARLTEMDQQHMLRCVHFPPDGKTLIIGGVNPMIQEDHRRRRGGGSNGGSGGNGGMSFYLRLWDFDVNKALEAAVDLDATTATSSIGIPIPRRAISNVRYISNDFLGTFKIATARLCILAIVALAVSE